MSRVEPFLLSFDTSLEGSRLRAALVWARGIPNCAKTKIAPPYLVELLGRVREAGEGHLPAERKAAVRDMLRYGSYKPAGRAKPSSEYLLAAALTGVDLRFGCRSSEWGTIRSERHIRTSPNMTLRGTCCLFTPDSLVAPVPAAMNGRQY